MTVDDFNSIGLCEKCGGSLVQGHMCLSAPVSKVHCILDHEHGGDCVRGGGFNPDSYRCTLCGGKHTPAGNCVREISVCDCHNWPTVQELHEYTVAVERKYKSARRALIRVEAEWRQKTMPFVGDKRPGMIEQWCDREIEREMKK